MADIHIDEFYSDCVNSLVRLYDAFPRLTSIYVNDLLGRYDTDEFGIPFRRQQACFDALLWLAEEGYIRYQDRVRTEGLDQVVLTEEALLRLSQPMINEPHPVLPPSVSRKRATRIFHLRHVLASGSGDKVSQACQDFFFQWGAE